jgi:hypothetical protein
MPMVRIGQVRMVVDERSVPVRVRVGLNHLLAVPVPVVFVVDVSVLMLQSLVLMDMAVTRPQHHGDADGHHQARPNVAGLYVLPE